jgi:hypothetical protein
VRFLVYVELKFAKHSNLSKRKMFRTEVGDQRQLRGFSPQANYTDQETAETKDNTQLISNTSFV